MSTVGRDTASAGDLVVRMLQIITAGEYDKLGEVMDEQVISEWPQSGERVRGLANTAMIFKHYPGGDLGAATEFVGSARGDHGHYVLTPMFTMVSAERGEDTDTSVAKSVYPDGSVWYVITFATARNGKLAKLVQYFAPVYPAPEWRSQWVERM